jgi:AhpD family alkylhydroperoxidase
MRTKVDEVYDIIAELKKELPQRMEAFENFWSVSESESALDTKTKQLINVALSVSAQCEWCIAYHVRSAFNKGATRQEILDAASMAVLMHGSPALTYMIPLREAVNQFESIEY